MPNNHQDCTMEGGKAADNQVCSFTADRSTIFIYSFHHFPIAAISVVLISLLWGGGRTRDQEHYCTAIVLISLLSAHVISNTTVLYLPPPANLNRFMQGLMGRRVASFDPASPDHGAAEEKCSAMDQIPLRIRSSSKRTLAAKGADVVQIDTGKGGNGFRRFVSPF